MKKDKSKKILGLLKQAHELVERGENVPKELAREIFPPERKEYELVYYGKELEEEILADTMALPLQPENTFGKNGQDWHNKLIFGDNLQAMKNLLTMKERGELVNADGTNGVKLVYIDPPFATKQDFRGSQEQKAYQDKIIGAEFLEFLRARLVIIKELLSDDGSIYVHLDQRKGHYVKILLDEIFGEHNFINEIIWCYTGPSQTKRYFVRKHDNIYLYSKSDNYVFNTEDLRIAYKKSTASSGKTSFTGNTPKEKIKELDKRGKLVEDWWSDIAGIGYSHGEIVDYPTQKSEALLERIIKASSNEGGIILDAFAGSGTTCAVAEKMKRRWIAIDAGKLAIYTIQKRMLNLKKEIGNKGTKLKTKPFTLYNAGLYDFDSLKDLSWKDWRFFALQLFECRDEPHKVGSFNMDGYRFGSSVLVFNYTNGQVIDYETIKDLHANIGNKLSGDKCFIIAPRGTFLFQEDFVEFDGVRYYALRIPYSYIEEIHKRNFKAMLQPNDEGAVNEIMEAVGFDFIQPPEITLDVKKLKKNGGVVTFKILNFESKARLKGKEKISKHEALSMVMIDYDYKDNIFDLDDTVYAHNLKDNAWKLEFSTKKIIGDVMLIFLDIYGNESRRLFKKNNLIK
jgi:DNA modification methylase